MTGNGKALWPGSFYGPGGKAKIFRSEADVPKGWADHPSTVGAAETVPVVFSAAPESGARLEGQGRQPMTQLQDIINAGYWELNLTAIGASPAAALTTKGILLLNRAYRP